MVVLLIGFLTKAEFMKYIIAQDKKAFSTRISTPDGIEDLEFIIQPAENILGVRWDKNPHMFDDKEEAIKMMRMMVGSDYEIDENYTARICHYCSASKAFDHYMRVIEVSDEAKSIQSECLKTLNEAYSLRMQFIDHRSDSLKSRVGDPRNKRLWELKKKTKILRGMLDRIIRETMNKSVFSIGDFPIDMFKNFEGLRDANRTDTEADDGQASASLKWHIRRSIETL